MTNSPKPATVPGSKRWRIACLFAAGVATVTAPAAAFAQDAAAPPPAVVVTAVKEETVSKSDQFVGRIQAIQSVDLVSRVEGFLEKLNFSEGTMVKKDDLLIGIEKPPYEAQLAAAKGQLEAAQAQVAGAQANLKNANFVLERQQILLKKGDVSQAKADDAEASRDIADAQLKQAQAAVAQAKAQVQTAEINLSYTDIKAPITGQIGATAVTVGNLVSAQTGTIANIVQLDPIRVAFSIPETLYTSLAEQTGGAADEAGDKDFFTPELTLSNGTKYDKEGKISFASNQISASTGSLVIYADFPNPKGMLLPGSFVSVEVKETEGTKLPVVPASAVLQDKDGRYVFVVNEKNQAEVRRIDTAAQYENGFPVTKGLTAGETVIVEGLQKVRAGITVTPTPMQTAAATTGSTPPTSVASTNKTASTSQ